MALLSLQQTSLLAKLFMVVALCLIVGGCKYLLILFSQLNSHHDKKEKQQHQTWKQDHLRANNTIEQVKQVYYMLLTMLYVVYFIAAFTLPFILFLKSKPAFAIITSIVLVCVFAQIIPRVALDRTEGRKAANKFMWVITLARLINKVLPLNNYLKNIFNKEVKSNIDQPFIKKQNVYKMLNLCQDKTRERPIKQEEVELLQKLRVLSLNSVKSLLIDQSNIFMLNSQTAITHKLINHLSRYYFSKILLYEKNKNNIVGFLQFKQLISYEMNQKINSKPELIVKNIIKIQQNDKLSYAFERMIQCKVNFALAYSKQTNQFKGLLKLKDIFSQLLLNWYHYEGLSVDRTFYTFTSQPLSKDYKGVLEQGQEQV